MKIKRLYALLYLILYALYASGSLFSQDIKDDDADIRNGIVNLEDDEDESLSEIIIPDFIDLSKNRIKYNGADWTNLRQSLAVNELDPFTIIHIGDSHIQADYATSVTRNLLQFDYGDAGRGLITPLKISGTNQPEDYVFSSHDLWRPIKLMKQPWKMTMGFTGTSITPDKKSSKLIVGLKDNSDIYSPFSSLIIFHHGKLKVNEVLDESGNKIRFVSFPSKDYTEITLQDPQNCVEIGLTGAPDLSVFGVSLSGNRPGVFYHTIGNNGATYSIYNKVGSVGQGISPLQPDLVIISLGTNEAFGKVNPAAIYENMDILISNIRQNNPGVQILLVTPMECQKSEYRTTTKRQTVKGKGKKRRTVNKQVKVRTGNYTPNNNVAIVRDVINRYAAANKLAVYDWYEVAGGIGASNKWIADDLFSKDRVHHSIKGYRVKGKLMYEALKTALDPDGLFTPSPSLIPLR